MSRQGQGEKPTPDKNEEKSPNRGPNLREGAQPLLPPSPPAVNFNNRGRELPDADEEPERQPNLEVNPEGSRGQQRETSTRRGFGRGRGRTHPVPQVAVRPSLSPLPPALDLDYRGRELPDADEEPERQPNLEVNPEGSRGQQRETSTRRGFGRGRGRTHPVPQVAVRPSLSPLPPALDLDYRGRGAGGPPMLSSPQAWVFYRHARDIPPRTRCCIPIRGRGRSRSRDSTETIWPNNRMQSQPKVQLEPYVQPKVETEPESQPEPPQRQDLDEQQRPEPQTNPLQILDVGEQSAETETQPESEVQSEPYVQPEVATEPDLQPESPHGQNFGEQLRPESQTDPLQILDVGEQSAKPETHPKPEVQLEPETQPKSDVQLEPDVQPEVATEPDLQHGPPQELVEQSQPDLLQIFDVGEHSAEPKRQPKSEVQLETDVQPEVATEPDSQPEPPHGQHFGEQLRPESQTDPLQILDVGEQSAKPETHPKSEVQLEPETQPKSDVQLEPDVQPEVATEPDLQHGPPQELVEQSQPDLLQIFDVGEHSAEPKRQPKSEVQLETDVQPEVATEPDSQPEPPHGQHFGEQLRPESQTDPLQILDVGEQSAEPESQPKMKVQLESDVQIEVENEPESQPEQPQELDEHSRPEPQPDQLEILDLDEQSAEPETEITTKQKKVVGGKLD